MKTAIARNSTLVIALALLSIFRMHAQGENKGQPSPIQDEPLTVPAIVYPADAKQSRIQGTVQLRVAVDATGHVTSVEALSGPLPLRQAAIDAYSHATYRPLLKAGHATPALVTTSVNFNINELPPATDELVDKQFQPLHTNCQVLSLGHKPDEDPAVRQQALAVCREAVAMATHFSSGAELEARATAYNDLVLLLIASGRYDGSGKAIANPNLPEAGTLANQAVDLITRSGTSGPHRPAVAVAYITRAEVRSLAGDLRGAAVDCAEAEEVLGTLVADQAAPDQKKVDRTANYRGQLHETLLLHAVILDRQHKPAEAQRLRHRAELI